VKERNEVLKVLNDLWARVHNRGRVAAEHKEAAIARATGKGYNQKVERGYVEHWDRQVNVHQMVEEMLAKLIEDHKNVHADNVLGSRM
jgi:hypothetical protein